MLKRYESWSDFVLEANRIAAKGKPGSPYKGYGGAKWAGGTFSESLRLAASGDESMVDDARRLMDKLDAVTEGAPSRQWTPSPFGAYPVVPEFIAGHPECMRNMEATGEVSPVAVYVSIVCSANITPNQMARRGAAILALVLKLQQIRPVELYLIAETHGKTDGGYYQLIPVDSKPLSLAHACYGIANVSFARNLAYAIAYHHDGFDGQWPSGYRSAGPAHDAYVARLRAMLDMNENDLCLKAPHATDPILSNPVAWVNEQLSRYSAVAY